MVVLHSKLIPLSRTCQGTRLHESPLSLVNQTVSMRRISSQRDVCLHSRGRQRCCFLSQRRCCFSFKDSRVGNLVLRIMIRGKLRAREMGWELRALVSLPQDPGSIPSAHIRVVTVVPKNSTLPSGLHRCQAHRHTQRQNFHIMHKIKTFTR